MKTFKITDFLWQDVLDVIIKLNLQEGTSDSLQEAAMCTYLTLDSNKNLDQAYSADAQMANRDCDGKQADFPSCDQNGCYTIKNILGHVPIQ